MKIWAQTPEGTPPWCRGTETIGTIIWDQRRHQQVSSPGPVIRPGKTRWPQWCRWATCTLPVVETFGALGSKRGALESALMLRRSFLKPDVPCRKGDVLIDREGWAPPGWSDAAESCVQRGPRVLRTCAQIHSDPGRESCS